MNDFGIEFSNHEISAGKKGGYRPELYTVAAGSYAANAVHSLSAPLVHSYAAYQLPSGTTTVPLLGNAFVTSREGCEYSQNGRDVLVKCNVTLSTALNPGYGAEELRIKPLRRNPVEPKVYLKGLPPPHQTLDLPSLKIDIVNKNGTQIVPDADTGAGNYVLAAKILGNGDIALIIRNLNAGGPFVPNDAPNQWRGLTHNDMALTFVPSQVISFNIQGSYLSS